MRQRTVRYHFHAAIIAAILCAFAPQARAQGLQPPTPQPPSQQQPSTQQPSTQPTPTQPAAPQPTPALSKAHSLLDEPPTPAHIQLTAHTLSIDAANSSLTELIRQLASDTGMQVEGNTRDQRVFGSWGPGTPPEVLSTLLYDTGYNVIMVGSTPDGAPRKLLLSARSGSTAGSSAQTTAAPRSNDEDDEEPTAAVEIPVPQPTQNQPPPPGLPPTPGQPRTPQQMLEELQRMHQGQQPQDLPHDPQ